MNKKNLFNFYIIATMMLYDFATFAQGENPEDDDEEGELENGDGNPVPINGKLIWLAIAGVLFALYIYRSYKAQEKTEA